MAESRRGCSQRSPQLQGHGTHRSNDDTNAANYIGIRSKEVELQQNVSAPSKDFTPHCIKDSSYAGQRNFGPFPVPERPSRFIERSTFSDESLSVSAFLESTECSLPSRRNVLQPGSFRSRWPSSSCRTEGSSMSSHRFPPSDRYPSLKRAFPPRANAPVPPFNRSVLDFPSGSQAIPRPCNPTTQSSLCRPPPPRGQSPVSSHDLSPPNLPSMSLQHLPPPAHHPRMIPNQPIISSRPPYATEQPAMTLRPPLPPPSMLLQALPPRNESLMRLPPPGRPPMPLRPPPFLNQPPDHFPMPLQPLPPHKGPITSHRHFVGLDPIDRFRQQIEDRRCAQKWIDELVFKCTNTNTKACDKNSEKEKAPLLIPLVRRDIKSCLEYLAMLEKKKKALQEVSDVQMWKWEVGDVQVAMATISDLMTKLRNSDLCKRLKLKLLKIRKKKGQRVRRRERIKAEEDERTEKTRRANAKIDEKREMEERTSKEKLKIEEENKRLRDSQEEVKQKQEEVKRYLRIIAALSKLRQARLQKRKVELGVHSDADKDESFQISTEKLNEVLQQQLKKYRAEEEAIAVRSKSDGKPSTHVNVLLEKIKECLFGEPLGASHPLYPLYLENTKADDDVDALIDIRSQWDKYMVSDDHPLGSRIPTDWVYPSED